VKKEMKESEWKKELRSSIKSEATSRIIYFHDAGRKGCNFLVNFQKFNPKIIYNPF
jgi:hypothetical protein